MQNKILYTILALLIIALVGLYIYGKGQTQNPEVLTSSNEQTASTILDEDRQVDSNSSGNSNSQTNSDDPDSPVSSPNNSSQAQYSDESDIQDPNISVHEVTYDGTKFTPASLTIKQGDIVFFQNNSEDVFWPASGPHPQHSNYPEFDAKKELASGKSFQFKFTKVGSWPYHDHLQPSVTGTIKVVE